MPVFETESADISKVMRNRVALGMGMGVSHLLLVFFSCSSPSPGCWYSCVLTPSVLGFFVATPFKEGKQKREKFFLLLIFTFVFQLDKNREIAVSMGDARLQ